MLRPGLFAYLICWCLFLPCVATGQIGSVRAAFDDHLGNWILYDTDEQEIGTLNWIPKSRDYFSEWKIYIDGTYGRIAPKWRNDPTTWEASIGNDLITIRQIWRNDLSEWRITDNKTQFSLESVYKNAVEEWTCTSKNGYIHIFTQYEFDFRDWIIEDTASDISKNVKAAIVSFAIILSISAN